MNDTATLLLKLDSTVSIVDNKLMEEITKTNVSPECCVKANNQITVSTLKDITEDNDDNKGDVFDYIDVILRYFYQRLPSTFFKNTYRIFSL